MNFRRTQLTISRWFLLKIGKQRRRRGIVGRRCVRSRHRFRLHRGRLLSAIVDCHRPPHAGQTCDRQAELSAERFVGRDNEADSADTCNARPYKETRFPINLAQWPPVLVHQFRTLIRNVAILKPDAYCRRDYLSATWRIAAAPTRTYNTSDLYTYSCRLFLVSLPFAEVDSRTSVFIRDTKPVYFRRVFRRARIVQQWFLCDWSIPFFLFFYLRHDKLIASLSIIDFYLRGNHVSWIREQTWMRFVNSLTTSDTLEKKASLVFA